MQTVTHEHLKFGMRDNRNFFDLSEENLKFLRFFQVFGVLPIEFRRNERILIQLASLGLTLLTVFPVVLKFFVVTQEPFLVALFAFEVLLVFLGQIRNWLTVDLHKNLLKILGEIDTKFKTVLLQREALMRANVKLQRSLVVIFTLYALATLYFPVEQAFAHGFQGNFFDSLSQVFAWSFLSHLNQLKFLYFYELLDVRLTLVKNCLKEMSNEKSPGKLFELSKKKFMNYDLFVKVNTIREIYGGCWELHTILYKASGYYLLGYFFAYTGQVLYVAYFLIGGSTLAGDLVDNLFEIILWLILINVSTVYYFIVSHNLHMRSLRIAGLIHKITQMNVNDKSVTKAVTLLSLQIQQQPIQFISILGLVAFDKTNMNGVSKTDCDTGCYHFVSFS